MRYKITFLAGLAGGYVLGAKAGRERYEAITRAARGLRDNPSVQETAGLLQAQAAGALDSARRVVSDTVSSKMGGRDATVDVTDVPAPYPATSATTAPIGAGGGLPH